MFSLKGTTARHRVLTAALLAGLCAPLAACSSEPDPFEGIPVFPVDAADVELLAEGENPQVLRYSDHADSNADGKDATQTTVAISAGIDQATAEAGAEVDENAPAGGDVNTTTLPLDIVAKPAPAPEGDEQEASREIDFTVGSGKHTDLNIGQDVASAEGFLMRWRADDRGEISTLQLLAPPEAAPRGLQLVEPALLSLVTTNVIFPEDPVGVGGTWTVKNRVAGDKTMVRTTTYTVEGIEGDEVTLGVDVDENPSQSSVTIDNDVAGELDGSDVEVESTSTTSEGRVVVNLRQPLPASGQVAATTRLVYSGGNEQARVVQDITRAVRYGD